MMPTVRIDDEVLEALKAEAEPFVDTPNTVIRRLLGLEGGANGSSPKKRERAKPGTILHRSEYPPAVLQAIANLGGSSRPQEVIDEAGKLLEDKLLPEDHEKISSGAIRWRNRVRWTAFRLRRSGLLGTERGIWALTDAGRDALKAGDVTV